MLQWLPLVYINYQERLGEFCLLSEYVCIFSDYIFVGAGKPDFSSREERSKKSKKRYPLVSCGSNCTLLPAVLYGIWMPAHSILNLILFSQA